MVTARLPESYQWLLVPEQVTPQAPITWEAMRLNGGDALAVRASRKLRSEDLLVTALGSTILRKHLDDVPLWRGDHVEIRQLVEDFTRYLYLPRLAGSDVLIQAACAGVALLTWHSDTFAYAESYDEAAGRYRGLRCSQQISITPDDTGLLVKPDVASKQLDAEVPPAVVPGSEPGKTVSAGTGTEPATDSTEREGASQPKRYHGTVELDPARAGRDASRIADEVISHLAGLVGSNVRITLEIDAEVPNGVPDNVVRTVTENGRTLRFSSQGFEEE